MNKSETYEWKESGVKGSAVWLDADLLEVDHSYQRGELNESYIRKIADNFSWEAFGSLTVMLRSPNGAFVVDGQQRLRAAKRLGIKKVPCMLHPSEGRDHEAAAFVALNVNRRSVSALDRFRARLSAGLNPEKDIAEMLESLGLQAAKNGTVGGIAYVYHLTRNFLSDNRATRAALEVEKELGNNRRYTWAVHNGLWYLETNGIQVARHIKKLESMGGYTAIEKKQKETVLESGALQITPRLGAVGIIRLINHRCRRRIKLPELSDI